MVETLAGQRPPLSCRTSPPQGGRSAGALGFVNRHDHRAFRSLTPGPSPFSSTKMTPTASRAARIALTD